MGISSLTKDQIEQLKLLGSISEEYRAIKHQNGLHEVSIKELSKLIRDYKGNRSRKLQIVVGGNIIVEKGNAEAIKLFQERKQQVEIALRGIKGQLEHREDVLRETYNKVERIIQGRRGD